MEVLLGLLVLAIPILLLLGPILGLIALSRTRALKQSVNELELRLSILARSGKVKPAAEPVPAEETRVATADSKTEMHQELTAEPPKPPEPIGFEVEVKTKIEDQAPAPAHEQPPVFVPPKPPAIETDPPIGSPPKPRFNWEQWIGVRGAAVGGGIVFAIASLLFFQYSIEHNLIPPSVRVVIGLVVGLVMIFGSEWLIGRRQEAAANALAGAGAVTLYASVWAAQSLYALIGPVPAFVLMALITVSCGFIALRRNSLVVAILGLFGGFTTPLLVASTVDQPISLFGYVLLLDAGLLWLARDRKWSILAILSLLGTAAHQALWIFDSMNEERALIGLAVLAVFAFAFILLSKKDDEESALWRLTRSAGVTIPFGFALHFAGSVELGNHIAPIGILLLLLCGCASWLAHRQEQGGLALMASGFSLGIIAVWFFNHNLTPSTTWEAVIVCICLGVVMQIASEFSGGLDRISSVSTGAVLFNTGCLAILALVAASEGDGHLAPWLVGWSAHAALLIRHSVCPGRFRIQLIGGTGLAFATFLFAAAHHSRSAFPDLSFYLALVVAIAAVFQAIAMLRSTDSGKRWAENGAAATALVLVLTVVVFFDIRTAPHLMVHIVALALGIFIAMAATRLRAGVWYSAAVVAIAAAHTLWTLIFETNTTIAGDFPLIFLIELVAVVFFTFWPSLSARAFAESRWAFYGAALSGPVYCLSLKTLCDNIFGAEIIAILPVGLGILSLGAAYLARRNSPQVFAARDAALAWFLTVTLCFISLAIPLQLDKEWITIGWALNGLAVIALWRHLDHPGLKYFGLALLGAAALRLVVNPEVLGYHHRSAWRIVNWLLYTYWVPAVALIVSSVILSKYENERLRPAERRIFGRYRSIASSLCGFASISVIFVWINLTIADFFSSSNTISLSFDRMPARDLSTAIAWAGYALVLLFLGIRMRSSGLRWLSLALLMATILKVFLYDLGDLEDLYRVGALLGLAVSMILVSLSYQRFVFRSEAPEK